MHAFLGRCLRQTRRTKSCQFELRLVRETFASARFQIPFLTRLWPQIYITHSSVCIQSVYGESCIGRVPLLDGGQWKLDSEFSAASDVTLHADITVMFLHDSIRNRQSKAGTRAHGFRCKKRIKDIREYSPAEFPSLNLAL